MLCVPYYFPDIMQIICGAYGFSVKDAKEVYDRFEVVNRLEDFKPRWNLRPGQMNPVITSASRPRSPYRPLGRTGGVVKSLILPVGWYFVRQVGIWGGRRHDQEPSPVHRASLPMGSRP